MFLWRALKPQAVLAAVSAISKGRAIQGGQATSPRDGRSAPTAPLRFANPSDPNSLT